MNKKAVVLLSGGMDSATVLAIAKASHYDCYALSFRYGQRHIAELEAAKTLVKQFAVVQHEIIDLNLSRFGGSALTDHSLVVPEDASETIPITYVPARNTIFLSFALAWAEVLEARNIFIGVNAVDYSGYPDCRPAFINAFEKTANVATKAGVEGRNIRIQTPLINLSKADIIHYGHRFNLDYTLTVSCYQADQAGFACGCCDACRLRRQGFEDAGLPDETRYIQAK